MMHELICATCGQSNEDGRLFATETECMRCVDARRDILDIAEIAKIAMASMVSSKRPLDELRGFDVVG